MKQLASVLLCAFLLAACGGHPKSSTDRLAESILSAYPDLNNSEQQYASAVAMAQSKARSWVGSVPQCLSEEDFLFSRCIDLYGQIYAVFNSPIGYAFDKEKNVSLSAYILVPVDYATATTLANDNAGSVFTRKTPYPHYMISGTMVNYDPADLNQVCNESDLINLGCLILGPSTITVVDPS